MPVILVKQKKMRPPSHGIVRHWVSRCRRCPNGKPRHWCRRIRKPRIIADVVSSAGIHLISQKAADALHDIWDKHATLYPVLLEDKPEEPYYMVVVHTVIDCLDREKSIGYKALEETERGQKGYFDMVTEWVMREEEIGDNELFVLSDKKTTIYTTEAFKQRVLQAGLTGFGFAKTRYFDDEPFIS